MRSPGKERLNRAYFVHPCGINRHNLEVRSSDLERHLEAAAAREGQLVVRAAGTDRKYVRHQPLNNGAEQRNPLRAHRQSQRHVLYKCSHHTRAISIEHSCSHREPAVRRIGSGARFNREGDGSLDLLIGDFDWLRHRNCPLVDGCQLSSDRSLRETLWRGALGEKWDLMLEVGCCLQGLAEVAERRGNHLEGMQHLDAAGEIYAKHGVKLYLDQVLAKKQLLKA